MERKGVDDVFDKPLKNNKKAASVGNLAMQKGSFDSDHGGFLGGHTSVAEWSEYFFKRAAKLVNPPDERLEQINQRNDPVQFYAVSINSVSGLQTNENLDDESPIFVQLNFFDSQFKKFFGNTWIGPGKKLTSRNDDLAYDEHVYFSSAIRDSAHILVVFELVGRNTNGKFQSFGWTAFRPFADTNVKNQELPVYSGTLRALLFTNDPFEKSPNLTPVKGCSINYSFDLRSKMASFLPYFPENAFIGRMDKVGGLIYEERRDYLEKPRLVPQMSMVIDNLYVYLNPTIAKFESELAQLVAEEKSLQDKVKIEASMISVTERRIKIGVHNGWKFLNDPHVVHLNIDDPSNKQTSQISSRRLSMKSSQKNKDIESTSSSNANRLVMRSSLILNDTFEDNICAIVFLVEYVVNVPTLITVDAKNKKLKDSQKQFKAQNVLLRWGVYCPFADQLNNRIEETRLEINLLGDGPETLNPEFKTIMKRASSATDPMSARSANGKITFDLRKGNHVMNPKIRVEEDYDRTIPTNDLIQPIDQTAIGTLPLSSRDNLMMPSARSARSDYTDVDRRKMMSRSANELYNTTARGDEGLQGSLGNMLVNQFLNQQQMSHMQRVVGLFGGNMELYPIYNPALHLPIMALAPGQIGGRTMSRAAYAKLQSANFPAILDRYGKPAEVVDGSSLIEYNLKLEENDSLACNQIVFQFLAYSVTLDQLREGKSESKPRRVFFTFQFYRFSEFKTPGLKLDKIIPDYSSDISSTPFILKYEDKPNNSHLEEPGYTLSYSIDPTNLKFGEKRMFLEYLAHSTMSIDVWDADSLHLIGTSTLQLKDLLRHGKDAVQATLELDVIKTEYDELDRMNNTNTYREGVAYSNDSHIKFQGVLHLRIGNIGTQLHDPSDPIHQTSLAPSLPQSRVIVSTRTMNAFGQDLKNMKIDELTSQGLLSHHFSKALHMTELFKDLNIALAAQHSQNPADINETRLDALKRVKLRRVEIARRQKAGEIVQPMDVGYHKKLIQERYQDLRTIEFYREQTKYDQIMNMLHEHITTEYAIYPNFGVVEFFEFVLTNPYNEPQTVTIVIDDPEIQVVTDAKEWRHLKLLHQIYTQTEDNMFNKEGLDPNKNDVRYPQVYMRPKETINVPFKFHTFHADNSVQLDPHDPIRILKAKSRDGTIRESLNKYEIRKSHIVFRVDRTNNPIAILRLVIDQQPHVINQTLRFYESEQSFLKKIIRLPSSARVIAGRSTALLSGDIKLDGTVVTDQGATSQVFARCSDPNVACESRPVSIGEPHDVLIRAPTGPSPSVRKFYVAIYADQYLAVPLEIWQVYVHSMQRVDVSCLLGQVSRFSLILRGTQSSRHVKCYSNYPDEMTTVPEDKFMLPANSVQEVNVGVQTINSGSKHYYLNVVDVESSQLVTSWFVNVHSKPPVVSKGFELTLPVATGSSSSALASQLAQKRVSYTNPYSAERVFHLSTNRDDLVGFKDTRMKFMPNEQKTISLRFLPNPSPGYVEIYIFINNEQNVNEETFALRVHYVRQYGNNNLD